MNIAINGVLSDFDPKRDSIILIFEDDEELLAHARNLNSFDIADGPRKYGIFPDDMPEDVMFKHMAFTPTRSTHEPT